MWGRKCRCVSHCVRIGGVAAAVTVTIYIYVYIYAEIYACRCAGATGVPGVIVGQEVIGAIWGSTRAGIVVIGT